MISESLIHLLDTHAGGDISRVVIGGIKDLPGNTMREKAIYLEKHADGLRKLLLSEPYGVPEMSVDLIQTATNSKAEAGYIIMEVMGYPVYSSSNTMCTVLGLLESNRIPKMEGEQSFMLESPAGLTHVSALCKDNRVVSVTCEGGPTYVMLSGETVYVPEVGKVTYDVVWSGGFYVMVDAQSLGFDLVKKEEPQLVFTGDAIIRAVRNVLYAKHPELGDVGPIPFLHYMGEVNSVDGNFTSPSATYVHPGVICRSPTGTGTSARLALMTHRNQIKNGQWLETISPRGSSFRGEVGKQVMIGNYRGVRSKVTGFPKMLARSEIIIHLDDPYLEDITSLV